MNKKINRQLLQDILSKGAGVTSVSAEAVDWVIEYAEAAAKNLADNGRRTPGGRLMRFNESADIAQSVDVRVNAVTLRTQEKPTTVDTSDNSLDRTAWRMAAFNGDTLLGFHEWNKEQK